MRLRPSLPSRALFKDPWLLSFGNLAAGEAMAGLLRFVALLWVARALGPSTFGVVGVGIAIAGYLVMLHSGLEPVGTRRVVVSDSLQSDVETVLGVRLVIATLAYGITALVLILVPTDANIRSVTLLFALSLFTLAVDLRWLFIAIERTAVVALAVTASAAFYLAGSLLFVRDSGDLLYVPALHVSAELILAAIVMLAGWRRFGSFRPRIPRANWQAPLKESLPISGSKAARGFILGFDVVLLEMIASQSDVGEYAAARRFILVGIVFLGLYYQAFLPRFLRVELSSSQDGRSLANLALKRALLFMIPLGVLGTTLGPLAVNAFLGDEYRSSGELFAILVWSVVLLGFSAPFMQILVAQSREKALFVATAIAAGASALLNIWLTPRFGPSGAALAAVGTDGILLIIVYLLVRDYVSGRSDTPRPVD